MIDGELYRDQIVAELRTAVRRAGGQKALAEKIGISPQYLHDMLNERRHVTGLALDYLGFTEMTVYLPMRRRR
jgi:hypothetical protein